MPDSTCSVADCSKPMLNKKTGWCQTHYTRMRRTGSLDAPTLCVCRGCGSEFNQSNVTGPKPKYCSHDCKPWKRKSIDGNCMGCSAPLPMRQPGERMRKYCRRSCIYLRTRRPASRQCSRCNYIIDMTARTPEGKLRYPAYTKVCEGCKKPNRYPLTVTQLAERDGPRCVGCGIEVDFTAVKPDPFSPSVDHIIPWSRGGANEPHNLQLMHLRCNIIKGAKLDK